MPPSHRYQNSVKILTPNPKFSPYAQTLPSAAYPKKTNSHYISFVTSKRFTYYQPTFTRRTSGHCIGTLTAVKLIVCAVSVRTTWQQSEDVDLNVRPVDSDRELDGAGDGPGRRRRRLKRRDRKGSDHEPQTTGTRRRLTDWLAD